MIKQGSLIFVVSIGLLFASPAHAYLDPGSSSLVAQTVIGCLLGFIFFFRDAWSWIKFRIGKNQSGKELNQSASQVDHGKD